MQLHYTLTIALVYPKDRMEQELRQAVHYTPVVSNKM